MPSVDAFVALRAQPPSGHWVKRTANQHVTQYLAGTGLGGGLLVNGLLVTDARDSDPIRAVQSLAEPTAIEQLLVPAWHSVGVKPIPAQLLTGPGASRFALHRLLDRCEIRHGAVERLIFDQKRFVAAELTDGTFIEADSVVVCAGTFGTPAILQRSVCAPMGTGRNLQDHASIVLTVAAPPVPSSRVPMTQIGVGSSRHGHGDLLFTSYAMSQPRLMVSLLDCRSRGSIDEEGIGHLDLLSDLRDVEALRTGLRWLLVASRRLLSAGYRIVGPDGMPASDLADASDGDISEWILANEGGTYHATGSCSSPSVINRDFTLRGVSGVRVIDASVIANSPHATPMADLIRLATAVA